MKKLSRLQRLRCRKQPGKIRVLVLVFVCGNTSAASRSQDPIIERSEMAGEDNQVIFITHAPAASQLQLILNHLRIHSPQAGKNGYFEMQNSWCRLWLVNVLEFASEHSESVFTGSSASTQCQLIFSL